MRSARAVCSAGSSLWRTVQRLIGPWIAEQQRGARDQYGHRGHEHALGGQEQKPCAEPAADDRDHDDPRGTPAAIAAASVIGHRGDEVARRHRDSVRRRCRHRRQTNRQHRRESDQRRAADHGGNHAADEARAEQPRDRRRIHQLKKPYLLDRIVEQGLTELGPWTLICEQVDDVGAFEHPLLREIAQS